MADGKILMAKDGGRGIRIAKALTIYTCDRFFKRVHHPSWAFPARFCWWIYPNATAVAVDAFHDFHDLPITPQCSMLQSVAII